RAASSYDNMAKYDDSHTLGGLNASALAFLGARFGGPYVDRQAAFGVLAWDTMAGYSSAAAVNGLDLGFGQWPGTGTTYAYIDRQNAFPKLAWDDMASYASLALIDCAGANLNGGTDNGVSLSWTGGYVSGQCPSPGCVASGSSLIT